MRYLLVLLTAGCSLGPHCVTRCGVTAWPTTSCETLQRSEDVVVEAYGAQPWGTDTCSRLQGWTIQVMRDDAGTPLVEWTDAWNRKVAGLTFCDQGVLQLGTDDWKTSAYSHEVVHVLRCAEPADHDHLDWADAGIWKLVEEAQH